MNYNKKTILDVDVAGKKILLRCDFNVPQDKETGAITSDKRIVAALPTIRYLLEKKAAVIACSHLGKPKGEWKSKLSLAPVAERLSQLLGQEVIFARDIVGEDAAALALASSPTMSLAKMTSCPSSSLRRSATGARLSLLFHSPLGLPRWEQAMTAAFFSSR